MTPPYEVSRDTNFQSGQAKGKDTDRFRVSMNFGDWDNNFTGLDTVISEAYRILRKSGTLICFYDLWKITTLKEYFDKAGFKQIRFIEWVKTNPVPINSKTNYLTNARETELPTTQDILDDVNEGVGLDGDNEYYNCWGITDHYNSCPLSLTVGKELFLTKD